jgi:hypothetical protein
MRSGGIDRGNAARARGANRCRCGPPMNGNRRPISASSTQDMRTTTPSFPLGLWTASMRGHLQAARAPGGCPNRVGSARPGALADLVPERTMPRHARDWGRSDRLVRSSDPTCTRRVRSARRGNSWRIGGFVLELSARFAARIGRFTLRRAPRASATPLGRTRSDSAWSRVTSESRSLFTGYVAIPAASAG